LSIVWFCIYVSGFRATEVMPRMVTRRGHVSTAMVMHKAFGVTTDRSVNVSETFSAKTLLRNDCRQQDLVMFVR